MNSTFTQSVTVGLQGFLNAIVYGWTRTEFLTVLEVTSSSSYHTYLEGGATSHRDKMERDTPELLSGTFNNSY